MEVLPQLNEGRVFSINEVPGLYISGRIPASSPSRLASEEITHIVSLLTDAEFNRVNRSKEEWSLYKVKHIAIEDDPNDDILIHLDDVYHWIDDALRPSPSASDGPGTTDLKSTNRVLIHCRQGVSRSGAFVVGYLMRKLSLPYSAALALARKSSNVITPNQGFEHQLRIYEHCNYDIYLPSPATSSSIPTSTSPPPVSTPGPEKVERQLAADDIDPGTDTKSTPRMPKPAYTAWKAYADTRSDRSRDRAIATANMAAEFGRKRLAAQREATSITSDTASTSPSSNTSQKQATNEVVSTHEEQWRRVEEMEKAWNTKLINGDVERAREAGNLGNLMSEVFESVGEESWRTFVAD